MSESEWSIEVPTDAFFGVAVGILALMVAGVAVAIVVRLVRTWQPKHQLRAVDSLSQKMNLIVPDHVREPLARAIAVRKRGSEIGSIIALAAFLLVIRPWSTPTPDFGLVELIPAFTLMLVGTSLGAVIGGLFARRSAPPEHRAARLTPLSFSDLIAPVENKTLVACLVAGVALPAGLMLTVTAPWNARGNMAPSEASLVLLAGLLAAGLGLALPRIGRMLVHRRAIAGDEYALAWSDALAARTLRDLVHLASSVSALAAMVSLMALGITLPTAWANAANALVALTPFLMAGALIAGLVVTTIRQPELHVQRTLWPQFAADAK